MNANGSLSEGSERPPEGSLPFQLQPINSPTDSNLGGTSVAPVTQHSTIVSEEKDLEMIALEEKKTPQDEAPPTFEEAIPAVNSRDGLLELDPFTKKDDQVNSLPGAGKGASFWGSVFNVCNYTMGAGVLTMPKTTAWTGAVFEGILLLLLAIFIFYTLKILVHCGFKTGILNYDELVHKIMGPRWKVVLNISSILSGLGLMCTYMVLIADFGSNITDALFDWESRRLTLVLLTVFLVLPLSLLRNLNSLRFTSILAIFFILGTASCITFDCLRYLSTTGAEYDVTYFKVDTNVFRALPIATFAFMCHLIVLPMAAELKDARVKTANKVVGVSVFLSFLLYFCCGIFGYLRFQTDLEGNVMNNYADDERDVDNRDAFTIFESSFLFVIVFSYPMVNFACRLSIIKLCCPGKEESFPHIAAIVVSLFLVSLVIGLTCEDVSIVYGLMGAVTAPAVTTIFPGLLLIWTSGKSAFSSFSNIMGVFTVAIGAILMVNGIIFYVVDLV
eukprot:GCRY01002523.1.p1 GENE.GCRY01002523.1~~GCRY01002523.1.p1  ORF type:complete len:503 (-),score=115.07 GCRY01002523.1:381-1889(-)